MSHHSGQRWPVHEFDAPAAVGSLIGWFVWPWVILLVSSWVVWHVWVIVKTVVGAVFGWLF